MCIQNLVSFCQFVLKILSKNQILTSSKGCYSVANLRKTKVYNTNIDLVNDNVYTKFGLKLFILSQILSKYQILTSIKGFNSVANFRKTMIYDTNIVLVNDNVYTNLVFICLFVLKILSKNLILKSIKGHNSVANLQKFELIQAFMHVLVTCKNKEDPIKNEGARVFTRFLPL